MIVNNDCKQYVKKLKNQDYDMETKNILYDKCISYNMYYHIGKDFVQGIMDSVRIDLIAEQIISNNKIKDNFVKICKWNLMLYIFTLVVCDIIEFVTSISIHAIRNYVLYPIDIISVFFHFIYIYEIVEVMCFSRKILPLTSVPTNVFVISITTSIYGFFVYVSTKIIGYIFSNNLYLISLIIKFLILTYYHSFYSFNNIWKCDYIDLLYRIDIHEKLWPYYIGFGLFPTILYLSTENMYVLSVYNIYTSMSVIIPFLIKEKYPPNIELYPSINLHIFSYFTRFIFGIFKKLINPSKKN